MSAPNTPHVTIVVLAYNEAENVPHVLRELVSWCDAHAPDTELIIIDDGSSDGTSAAADATLGPRGRVIRHATNRGMGAGLKTGAKAASGEWITFMPADGQIPPGGIGALLSATGDDVDLVLSVYRGRNDGASRKVLSWGMRALIATVHGVQLESEGPYMIRRRLFDGSQLEADTFFLNFEVPIRALAAGLSVRHVKMDCRPRLAGQSKTAHPGRVVNVAKELIAFRLRRLSEAARRITGS